MQFIVSQEPQMKHRAGLVVRVVVVTAKTKAEALRVSDGFFAHNGAFCKPKATRLEEARAYNF